MTIEIPSQVAKIIKILEDGGFEAYAVGGCVRDSILGREPDDWDITTSARPEEVKKLFRKTVDTGIKHGTVTVCLGGGHFEVTTFRVDGIYIDGRHPEDVTFSTELREDLCRRDFTINAMAYNPKSGLVDLYGGMADLEKRVIRAVGEPVERFTEDALRILRAVRFSAQLGFEIDEKTFAAAKALSNRLFMISAERIREEFMKTLLSDRPEAVGTLYDIGALDLFFSEYGEKREETERLLWAMPAEKIPRLSALFGRSGRDLADSYRLAERVLDFLKFDNDTRNALLHVIRFSTVKLSTERVMLRRFLNACGRESYENVLLFIEKADGIDMEPVRSVIRDILEKGECTSLKELAVSGKDLMSIGMRPGKAMGEILMELLAEVLDDPAKNERAALLERAETLYAEMK